MIIGVALIAMMGFGVLNAGIGTQSASLAGALTGDSAKADAAFTVAFADSELALVDFDKTILDTGATAPNSAENGSYAFTQGIAAGLIDNLLTELSALLSPIDTALAVAELGRLLATDPVGTINLLYDELIVSQIDTLINGTDYERGFVLGNQVSALKALSVLSKASSAAVLVGATKRADNGLRNRTDTLSVDAPETPRNPAGPSTNAGTGNVANQAVQPGDVGTYGELNSRRRASGQTEPLDMDHQPSFAAQARAREEALGRPLTKAELSQLKKNTPAVASPRKVHQQSSPTYGGRNNPTRIAEDAKDLDAAAARDRAVFDKATQKK